MAATHRVRVWDLPTRICHWLLAVAVIGLFVTGKIAGAAMPWHAWFGYAVATLLLFRIAWGLAGGHWSRFASFLYSPASLWRYLRGTAPPAFEVGHTPLGALSVFAMLLMLSAQVATGLFSDDQEEFAGPLNGLVSERVARQVTRYHKEFGETVLIVLVLVHVGAIAWYRWRAGRDLLGPMWHGNKQLAFEAPASRDDARSRWFALALLGACAAIVAVIVTLG